MKEKHKAVVDNWTWIESSFTLLLDGSLNGSILMGYICKKKYVI